MVIIEWVIIYFIFNLVVVFFVKGFGLEIECIELCSVCVKCFSFVF